MRTPSATSTRASQSVGRAGELASHRRSILLTLSACLTLDMRRGSLSVAFQAPQVDSQNIVVTFTIPQRDVIESFH